MSAPADLPVTVFVCTTCRRPIEAAADGFATPGRELAAVLVPLGDDSVRFEPVECLSVCKRPATIALSGADRWGYVVGDLDPALHIAQILEGARAYARSSDGIVPWRQRPQIFRKGVIGRIPPRHFQQPEKTP